jgi:hypothetical protein
MAHVDLAWQPSLLDASAVEIDPEFHTLRRRELADGAWVDHAPGWCRGADALFAGLLEDTPWSGREVRMYDRIVPEPRLTHRWRLDDGPAPPVELCEMAGVLSVRYGVAFTQGRRQPLPRRRRQRRLARRPRRARAAGGRRRAGLPRCGAAVPAAPHRWRAFGRVPARSRRPAGHGRVLSAHLAALRAQDACGGAADQCPVPPRLPAIGGCSSGLRRSSRDGLTGRPVKRTMKGHLLTREG